MIRLPYRSSGLVLLFSILLVSCGRSPQEESAAWIRSAKKAFDSKDYDRAILDLQNATKAMPTNAEAHYQLGLAFMKRGNLVHAVRSLENATDLQSANAGAHLAAAEILSASDDPKLLVSAQKHAEAAVAVLPHDPEALRLLAISEWRQGRTPAAVQHLNQALAVAPGHLKSSLGLALIQLESGDKAGAERTLNKAVQQSSGSADAAVALGRFYLLIGDAPSAEARFKRAVELDSFNGPALVELARIQQSSGRDGEADLTLKRLSALPERSYRTYHAEYLIRSGRVDAGIQELRLLALKDPANPQVRTRLVDLLLETGRVNEAEETLAGILRSYPNDTDATIQLADAELRKGQVDKAKQNVDQVLRIAPQSARAHLMLAKLLVAKGNPDASTEELRRAVDLGPDLLPARLALSQILRRHKSLKEAIDVLDAAPPGQKNELAFLEERTWVLLALGRQAEAKTETERALDMARTPAVLTQAALVKIGARDFSGARALLEEAIRAQPENVEALSAIAYSLSAERGDREALSRVRAQASTVPRSASVQFLLGSWLEKTGDPAGARVAYANALAADPQHTGAAIAAARLDMSAGKLDSARELINLARAREPRNVDALLALAMLEEVKGNYAASITAYRAVLRIDSSHLVAKNNLAVRLADSPATVDEALLLAQQVKDRLPAEPEVDDTIGWVYYQKGMHRAAVKSLEQASARSSNPRIRYHLAMAYFKSGNVKAGQATLAAAMKLNPNLPEAEQARNLAVNVP